MEETMLICENCGKQDESVKMHIDPYIHELFEDEEITILCDECYQERIYEI